DHTVRCALLSMRSHNQASRECVMIRCTERDKKLIVKCGLCRWLTTTQIHRLYFPGATVNAVQKRLRKLAEAGYLRTYRETSVLYLRRVFTNELRRARWSARVR